MAVIGYVEETDFTTWAAARDITLSGSTSVLLTKALDFTELQNYLGLRTEDAQPLSWPRKNVYIDGILLDSATVPDIVKELQMRVAADMDAGADPLAIGSQQVKSKAVDSISISYMEGSYKPNKSSQVRLILNKITTGSGANTVSVCRG